MQFQFQFISISETETTDEDCSVSGAASHYICKYLLYSRISGFHIFLAGSVMTDMPPNS